MFDSEGPIEALRAHPTEYLVAEYSRLDALEASVRARRLLVLAVLDERRVAGTTGDGTLDTAGWVAAESKLAAATARADVAAARALRKEPEVAAVALEGLLSRDQVTLAAQLAQPGRGRAWAERAAKLSPQYLAREARKLKRATPDPKARHTPSQFWWKKNEDSGRLHVHGDFTADDGAKFVRALERKAEQMGAREDGTWAPFQERCAQALVALASQTLAEDADPDRATVVLHAPVPAWADPRLGDGLLGDLDLDIASDITRRLACDANIQWIGEAFDGTPLGVGRRSRTVPRWLDRLVRYRDRHCRFPGCERLRGAQVHHIVHWADLGPTDYVNLVLLCPRHHTFLHEHKWSVRGNPSLPDDLVFVTPDGREHPPRRGDPPGRVRDGNALALAA
jgi:HNH endonuclease